MSDTKYTATAGDTRAKLKLAHLPTKSAVRLRLGGMEPSEDMQPGTYKVACEGASKRPFKDGIRIELKYRVIDGPHTGTALRQWITVHASGVFSPRSRYATQCAVALGRPLEASDNPDDPASIFSGRIFQALVGFRKTEKPHGGKEGPDYALRRKDPRDGLRVHELVARDGL